MRKFITFFILTFALLSCGLKSYSMKLVEEGKTWWYWSGVYVGGDPTSHHLHVAIGLTLGAPDSADTDWLPCYAIDYWEQKIIQVPVAHLKEKDKKVWIRPNLHLNEIDLDNSSNELNILSTFLGYWGGNNLSIMGIIEEPVWNPEPAQTEFLLYDFNYGVGDAYKWPWSGINYYDPFYYEDNKEYEHVERGWFVTQIEDENFNIDSTTNSILKVYTIKQAEEKCYFYNDGKSTIVEGIGITGGNVYSFYSIGVAWYGFFISPASISLPAYTSTITLPYEPNLAAVIDKDGTYLYGTTYFKPGAGISKHETDQDISNDKIFDLHGQEVTTPLPGSIYIRNGKKFVVR